MRRLVVGILAHVDSGKTTLSESLLYTSGTIRKLGRVDSQDAFLDTYAMEKERGITIFSKQATLQLKDIEVTLLDTPGHVDFSAEMERSLQVLDVAILIVSAADGVQGHTETLWRLLAQYQIPVFLFVNKMDQAGVDRGQVLSNIKDRLSDACLDFDGGMNHNLQEELAMCKEELLDLFLNDEEIPLEKIRECIKERRCYPVYFGSALKCIGIGEFIEGFCTYVPKMERSEQFGARVFKISRDEQGNRLTYCKVTGGTLKVKSFLEDEKINQLRIYSGAKYTLVEEAEAGMVVAVTGLSKTYPGQGFGIEEKNNLPVLEPILNYALILPQEIDPVAFYPKCKQIEEEEPELHFTMNESSREIQVSIMGQVQLEILQRMLKERFRADVTFGDSQIVYKETIANTVEGVGHFEPLRHYAEVHLLLEPGEPGSGVTVNANCSEDILAKNWQRLILTHLQEREFVGVLTGSHITDIVLTVVSGRAHPKHTEGGDFRQATYRAVRQGLMQAENVLLEPVYAFEMEVPTENIGRAMSDIEKMYGYFEAPEMKGENTVLSGIVPVSTMMNYQKELVAYTKGRGRLRTELHGYQPCHNSEQIISEKGYNPELDVNNPTGSVFCAHGAGFIVPWSEVFSYMHMPALEELRSNANVSYEDTFVVRQNFGAESGRKSDVFVAEEEWKEIFERTYGPIKERPKKQEKGRYFSATEGFVEIEHEKKSEKPYVYKEKKPIKEYLLVDGYNLIFAWEELRELAELDINAARTKLMDILSNYQGYRKCEVILVFDAYRLEGHQEEIVTYHNISVVYTKEAETADRYIERCAHEMGHKYQVTVVTSDGAEQVIVIGSGCHLVSSREFEQEFRTMEKNIRTEYLEKQPIGKRFLFDTLSEDVQKQIQGLKDQGKER